MLCQWFLSTGVWKDEKTSLSSFWHRPFHKVDLQSAVNVERRSRSQKGRRADRDFAVVGYLDARLLQRLCRTHLAAGRVAQLIP